MFSCSGFTVFLLRLIELVSRGDIEIKRVLIFDHEMTGMAGPKSRR